MRKKILGTLSAAIIAATGFGIAAASPASAACDTLSCRLLAAAAATHRWEVPGRVLEGRARPTDPAGYKAAMKDAAFHCSEFGEHAGPLKSFYRHDGNYYVKMQCLKYVTI
ncbi:hypothetical protein [Streptomyces sp. NBC_00459]|uniref:hypothetical protein n=1 Tax=Streptomyces sp. NBC_00459 TaxID=2975749 RepID=UPI002E18D1F9